MAGTNLTVCKDCSKEVSKSAKVCPHCGKKLKMSLWLKLVLGFVGFIVLVGIFGEESGKGKASAEQPTATATTTSQSGKTAPTAEAQKPVPQGPKIGVPFRNGNVEFTLLGFEQRNRVGSEFFNSKPAEGGTYVAFKWKYKNISSKPIGMFDQPKLAAIVDGNGVRYEPDVGASAYYAAEANVTDKSISDVNPGITVTNVSVFEIAKGQFNKDTWVAVVSADDDVKVSLK